MKRMLLIGTCAIAVMAFTGGCKKKAADTPSVEQAADAVEDAATAVTDAVEKK